MNDSDLTASLTQQLVHDRDASFTGMVLAKILTRKRVVGIARLVLVCLGIAGAALAMEALRRVLFALAAPLSSFDQNILPMITAFIVVGVVLTLLPLWTTTTEN